MSTTLIKNKQWFDENAIDPEFIAAHEDLTPKGRIHVPVSSAEILTKFRERATSLGLKLYNEKGALKRDGMRYMYVADVQDDAHPDYALSIGFRNNSDQSLAFSSMLASHVFVCQNGVCHGIFAPSKMRHTIGNVSRNLIDTKLDLMFSKFAENRDEVNVQIETMRRTPLTDEIIGKFVRRLNGEWRGEGESRRFAKNPLIGSSNLMAMLAELENPTVNNKDDNSVFRLLNAASYVTTHKMAQRNPAQALMASREVNNVIMSLIRPEQRLLGDVVDVDVEIED